MLELKRIENKFYADVEINNVIFNIKTAEGFVVVSADYGVSDLEASLGIKNLFSKLTGFSLDNGYKIRLMGEFTHGKKFTSTPDMDFEYQVIEKDKDSMVDGFTSRKLESEGVNVKGLNRLEADLLKAHDEAIKRYGSDINSSLSKSAYPSTETHLELAIESLEERLFQLRKRRLKK